MQILKDFGAIRMRTCADTVWQLHVQITLFCVTDQYNLKHGVYHHHTHSQQSSVIDNAQSAFVLFWLPEWCLFRIGLLRSGSVYCTSLHPYQYLGSSFLHMHATYFCFKKIRIIYSLLCSPSSFDCCIVILSLNVFLYHTFCKLVFLSGGLVYIHYPFGGSREQTPALH